MKAAISLLAVLVLAGLAYLGTEVLHWQAVFGVVLPYVALVLFLGGLIWRVVNWARSPVPFRIPTTCGQEKSLPWIRQNKFDNPYTTWQVIGRMLLEILFFRSLFRNTRMAVKEGERVVYGPTKWLWLGGLAFHYSFLVIILRHLRFFTQPVPYPVNLLSNLDGFFQVGVPVFYITSFVLLGALGYLLLRRLYIPQVRYISLVNDYFPLFLLLGIGTCGFLLRYMVKTDIVGIKQLSLGLVSFHPQVPDGIHYLFYMHLFLICVLFAYFPFSKLTHMAGVFMSPTRNLANNNRARRHINPWNPQVKVHTYEEYEDDFREKMIAAGIPVDKQPGAAPESGNDNKGEE
ncbi:MAG TPA: sulfate reduction electron transfer complex DsrMKJOP subunit DsrM [Myxococcota bacterium]|nr:sulfate reduction electron transfer complex DsrMKJOP subunit DsrM [Myxococcota bacterium]